MNTGFWWGQLRERPLRRSRRSWEDNIEMDLTQVGWKGIERTDLAEDMNRWRVLESGTEPPGSIKCGNFLDKLRTCQLPRKDSALRS